MTAEPQLVPCGDRAALAYFGAAPDPAVNARVHAAARALTATGHPALGEVVPAYASLLVEYDPLRLRWAELRRLVLQAAAVGAAGAEPGRRVQVPVWYGGQAGPDLDDVAAHTGLAPAEVLARHAAGAYRVYCLGFSPGFCYLGGLDPALATPRLASPRTRVPAGSVGIGGAQTGIYPAESPGGWRLIGLTPATLFDPDRERPSLLEPGDGVEFVPIGQAEFERLRAGQQPWQPPGVAPETGRPGLRILEPGLLTTVQDTGRRGWQALGVPVAGAADYWAIMVGNWLLGNRSRTAALEMTLAGAEVEFTGPVAFCLTGAPFAAQLVPAGGGSPVPVPGWSSCLAGPGDRLRVGPAGAGCRGYLCVAGGIDVPPVLGSRSEDLFAKLGPFGRPLRAGDWLPVGHPVLPPADLAGRALPADALPRYGGDLEVRVVLGPQQEAFTPAAVETFLSAQYRVGQASDRQGARLEGPALAHREAADILSEGVPVGSVQVPAGGQPILLLSNRQTIGGYAKIACAIYADVARAAQLRPGDAVRFRALDLGQAHAVAWSERRKLAQVRRYLQREAASATGRGRPLTPGRPAPAPGAAPDPAPAPAPAVAAPPDAAPAAPGQARHFKVRLAGLEFAVEVVEE